MEDERVWMQRLKLHLVNNINPLLPETTPICSEEVINCQPLQFKLAESEVVTIRHLTSKISRSFTAGQGALGEETPSITNSCHPPLCSAPVFLIGVLKFRVSPVPGLILADSTADIPCEVTSLPGDCIGRAIVPTNWNLIFSKSSRSPTYLELQEIVVLQGRKQDFIPSPISPPLHSREDASIFSISSLHHLLQTEEGSRCGLLDVWGRVAAVSEVLRLKEVSFLVVVADEDDAECCLTIFINRMPSQSPVLSSTSSTLISSHHPEHDWSPLLTSQLDSQAPHPTRPLSCDSSSPACKKIKCCHGDDIEERQVSSNNQISCHLPHPTKGCVSYQHISGFFCSALSRINFIQFSSEDSLHSAFFTRNKLISTLRCYTMVDTCWLLQTFVNLLNQDHRRDSRSCWHCLGELCRHLSLPRIHCDIIKEFITGPNALYLEEENLSTRPFVPSLASFKEMVEGLWSSEGFQWTSGAEEEVMQSNESRPELVYVIRTEWTYAVLRASELKKPQVLVGILQGCSKSGFLVLQDSTGQFPVLFTSTTSQTVTSPSSLKDIKIPATNDGCRDGRNLSKLSHITFGTKIVVTNFLIIFERTVNLSCTDAPSSGVIVYLHIINFSVVSCSLPTSSLRSRTNSFHECPSFMVRDDVNGSNVLFFRVLNKNISVISSLGQLEFTCQVVIHSNLDVLALEYTSDRKKDVKEEKNETALKVAIHFRGDAYKWFPVISNGCVYSLSFYSSSDSVLPSWDILMRSLMLTVQADMEIKLVQDNPKLADACDVMDISCQLLLPRFPTVVCVESTAETRTRSHWDSVSIRGMVTSHSYRVDHMSLAGKLPPLNQATITSVTSSTSTVFPRTTNKCKIVAITIQSLKSPDILKVYLEFRDGIPLPLGLLPGVEVTLHALKLKMSQSGNYYCSSYALTSIQVHDMGGVITHFSFAGKPHHSLRPEMVHLPVTYLGDMVQHLLRGQLSRCVVCVRVGYVVVQHVHVVWRCRSCQCVVVDGRCSAACLKKRPFLEASVSLMVEDGSGCGYIYASGHVVRECLKVSSSEWQELCDLVAVVGEVTYTKSSCWKFTESAAILDPSTIYQSDKPRLMLHKWTSRAQIQRYFKLFCQPFVSQAERERSIVGVKSDNIRLRGLEFSTLALPRLQLRGLALLELDSGEYTSECKKLLDLLSS